MTQDEAVKYQMAATLLTGPEGSHAHELINQQSGSPLECALSVARQLMEAGGFTPVQPLTGSGSQPTVQKTQPGTQQSQTQAQRPQSSSPQPSTGQKPPTPPGQKPPYGSSPAD